MSNELRYYFNDSTLYITNLVFIDKNVMLQLFRKHAMSFYGAKSWNVKFNKKDLKTFQYLIIKLSNVSVEKILMIKIISVLNK